jgi:signal transduction histidine kinase
MNAVIKAIANQSVGNRPEDEQIFSIDELVILIKWMTSTELKLKNCQLEINVDERVGNIKIKGNIAEVSQCILSLVRNSIESYDGNSGAIGLTIIQEKNELKIIISDSGKGVPDSVKSLLLKGVFTTKPNHFGIGLYVANSIVKARFGGSVDIGSEEGKGTEVVITLPLGNQG